MGKDYSKFKLNLEGYTIIFLKGQNETPVFILLITEMQNDIYIKCVEIKFLYFILPNVTKCTTQKLQRWCIVKQFERLWYHSVVKKNEIA